MNGKGVVRGLGVVLQHFFDTYIVDIQARLAGRKRYYTPEGVAERSNYKARGILPSSILRKSYRCPRNFATSHF